MGKSFNILNPLLELKFSGLRVGNNLREFAKMGSFVDKAKGRAEENQTIFNKRLILISLATY